MMLPMSRARRLLIKYTTNYRFQCSRVSNVNWKHEAVNWDKLYVCATDQLKTRRMQIIM